MTQVGIAAAGAVCSIGTDFPAISAAVRGQINVFRAERQMPSARDGRPLILARLKMDTQGQNAAERMLAMSVQAASECLSRANLPPERGPLPILLALPAERPGWGEVEMKRFGAQFGERLAHPPCPDRSGTITTGHHGGLAAMGHAAKLIENGDATAVLVGGVNSFDMTYLDVLDRMSLLKAPDVPNGFIPGECAAFLLLVAQDHAPSAVMMRSIAEASEPHPWYDTEQPLTGDGLANVVSDLLDADDAFADVVYSDMSGASWRTEEWVIANLRSGGKFGEPLDIRHPADCWGDLDAASGPMLTALAVGEMLRGSHKSAMINCSSCFAPFRAGAMIERAALKGTSR